jgi:hypothetical protein
MPWYLAPKAGFGVGPRMALEITPAAEAGGGMGRRGSRRRELCYPLGLSMSGRAHQPCLLRFRIGVLKLPIHHWVFSRLGACDSLLLTGFKISCL